MTTFNRNFSAIFIMLSSVSILTFAQARVPVYNVKKYGAKGNGKNLDTKAIDKARLQPMQQVAALFIFRQAIIYR